MGLSLAATCGAVGRYQRRVARVVPVLLGVLVLTAGCIDFSNDDDDPPNADFGSQQVNSETMLTDSVVLSEVESFEYNSTFLTDDGNQTHEVSISGALVVDERRGIQSRTGSLENTSTYTDGNITFVQSEEEGQTLYNRYASVGVAPSSFAADGGDTSSGFADAAENLTLERTGYEEYHGDTVAVYEHARTENVTGSDIGFTFDQSAVNVEERRLVFRMTEDGRFVSHEYRFTGTVTESGEDFVVRQRADVHSIDSATVEEPEWVATAREETSDS